MDAAARVMTCIARGADRHACGNPTPEGSAFCRVHEQDSPARRGGWISAERRRRQLALEHPLDASNVATRLWVGGRPPADRDLPGFDLLVLCAQEYQPAALAFHGQVLRCPIPDARLDIPQLTQAVLTAKSVGDALIAGQRVLVTCWAGLNRSALIAGMALARARAGANHRMTADDIIARMRARRNPHALYNLHFQDVLRRIVRR